jgi:hypothetical protein
MGILFKAISMTRTIRRLVAGVLFCLMAPALASAIDFDYAKIADSLTTVPVVGGTFTAFDTPVIDGYNVALPQAVPVIRRFTLAPAAC